MRRALLLVLLVGCEKASPPDFAIGWDMFKPGDRYEIAWTSHVDAVDGAANVQRDERTAHVEVLAVDGDRTSKERLEILRDAMVIEGHAAEPMLGTFEASAPSVDGPLEVTKVGARITEAERRDIERWQRPVMTLMARQKPFFTHRFTLGQTYTLSGADAMALGFADYDGGATFTLVSADDKQLRFTIAAKATRAPDGAIARPELVGRAEYGLDRERMIHRVIDVVYYDAANQPIYRVHQDSTQRRLLKQTAAR